MSLESEKRKFRQLQPTGHRSVYAVQAVISGVPKSLFYSLPPELGENIQEGYEVTVELNSRKTRGWVVRKLPLVEALREISGKQGEKSVPFQSTESGKKNKESQLHFFGADESKKSKTQAIKPVLAASCSFLPEQLPLFGWIAEYYGCPLAEVIDSAVPARQEGRPCFSFSLTQTGLALNTEALDAIEKKAPVQGRILTALRQTGKSASISELLKLGASVRDSLKALEQKGYVEQYEDSFAARFGDLSSAGGVQMFSLLKPETLSADQERATEQICANLCSGTFQSFLLFGVTGSGKTEVYLQCIERVLARGGSALVIVPEIALTPQLVDQFQARLGQPLAVLHSQVGASQRWASWKHLLDGRLSVAVGARSAVFAPLKNLSLIIVDEEHESSYKQSEGLRYNARDVAVMRAKFAGAAVVLGSATPSFESLINVKKNRYTLIEMPTRVSSRPVPSLEIIDLNSIRRKEMPSENISPPLHEAIKDTLNRRGQAIILYNRRGFSSYLQCTSCDEVVSCPNCSVALTLHRAGNSLLCHYCNLSLTPPTHCPYCRDPRTTRVEIEESDVSAAALRDLDKRGKLVARGAGTEKVVEELAALFPQARILQMDRDTVTRKNAYRQILGSMRTGDADILVGTQMIAKGHDLPGVTLVGIIDSDVGLHLPDFRASEKIYQLITQAAGRAGRGEEQGRVLVQTREPKHPTIVATATGRFKAFARYELDYRRELNYPPIGRLMRIIISSPNAEEAFCGAELTKSAVSELAERKVKNKEAPDEPALKVLGPAPCPHEKLRGRYRWHILVKAGSAKLLSELASEIDLWKGSIKTSGDLRLIIDVDPLDML